MTRNRILGAIGALWGGWALLARSSSSGGGVGNSAYETGHTIGLVLAALLAIVGLYYLIKG